MKGEAIGALFGLPVTIKDLTETAGIPTERGSHSLKDHVPTVDAPVILRLEEAGAIILGKTTTSEFGWSGVSHSPLTGITSNPWKEGYNTGASSAGAGRRRCGRLRAAAPGLGRRGLDPHAVPLQWDLRAQADLRPCAQLAGAEQRPDLPRRADDPHRGRRRADAAGDGRPPPVGSHQPGGRAGRLPGRARRRDRGPQGGLQPRSRARTCRPGRRGTGAERGRGLRVPRLHGGEPGAALRPPRGRRSSACSGPSTSTPTGPCSPSTRTAWTPASSPASRAADGVTGATYLETRARKLAYIEAVHRFFEEWDLLLTPAVSTPAFPAERLQPEHWPQHPWDWIMWAEFSYPFNFSHNPAASVPCGFTEAGLPVGLQIVGKRFADLTVLQAARAFEQARPWRTSGPRCERGRNPWPSAALPPHCLPAAVA